MQYQNFTRPTSDSYYLCAMSGSSLCSSPEFLRLDAVDLEERVRKVTMREKMVER